MRGWGRLAGRLARRASVLVIGSVCASPAMASVTTQFIEGRFHVRHDGEMVINTTEAMGVGGIRPEITVVNHADGFDLELYYKNNDSEPQIMGQLEFWGFQVSGQLHMRHFRHECTEGPVVLTDGGPRFFSTHYPSDAYSPVMTLRDDERTIGVTVQYPVLEYETGSRLKMRATDLPMGGHKWAMLIEFQRMVKDDFSPGRAVNTLIPPGEERNVTVSFRMTHNHDDWFDLLRPYVSYFHETYGSATTYRPDHRAVRGFSGAQITDRSPSNPRAIGYGNRRPDVHGWRRWSDAYADVRRSGFQRTMTWAPSGLFIDDNFNYPFLFASPLMESKRARDTIGFLRGLGPRGVELGFWWGRSQLVMFGWDDPRAEIFDPENQDHVDRAFAELDAASR
ncbi:MAG: hypothetical protein AAGK04_06485, partial [Planctomycetota bacterium]